MTNVVTNPKHLYRSLLRETTYLFDSRVRSYCYEYVKSAFRHHRKVAGNIQQDASILQFPSQAESRLLKRGRKFLGILYRANHGYLRAVNHVLRLAYARTGKRRRLLMSHIMEDEPSIARLEENSSHSEGYTDGWNPPNQFSGLLKSQLHVHRFLGAHGKLTASPKIPEKNTWGRPMPKSRVKNMNRKWYSKIANLLSPPLSDMEWYDVFAKSSGAKPLGGRLIRHRRPCARSQVQTEVKQPCCEVEQVFSNMLSKGPQKDPELRHEWQRRQRPHKLRPRFLRRRIAQVVLKHTPLALVNSNDKNMKYRWEEGIFRSKASVTCNNSQATTLFG